MELEALTLGTSLRLEELVDRDALTEMVRSFQALFGIPLRILRRRRQALGRCVDGAGYLPIHRHACAKDASACARTIGQVKAVAPRGRRTRRTLLHRRDVPHRPHRLRVETLGKFIVGPFLPADVTEVPPSLLAVDPAFDAGRGGQLLSRMPRAKRETVARIARTCRQPSTSSSSADTRRSSRADASRQRPRELPRSRREDEEAAGSVRPAKELDRLKSNFLATVSHELRTPLTSIIGYSEMLAEGIAGPLAGSSRSSCRPSTRRASSSSLIMSLLDLSKLESGTMSLKKPNVGVGKVLGDVVADARAERAQEAASSFVATIGRRAARGCRRRRASAPGVHRTSPTTRSSSRRKGARFASSASRASPIRTRNDERAGEGLVLLAPRDRAVECA